VTNQQVAAFMRRIADTLEIKGEIVYKVRAYRRAADNIDVLERDIDEIWGRGELRQVPGVGAALEKKLDEWLQTGRLEYYEKLRREVPDSVVALLDIPDVGPKTARLLWKELGVTDIGDVERAAHQGKLRELPGLGERSEQRILQGIESLKRRSDRIPLRVAWPIGQELVLVLRHMLGIETVELVGSLRRMEDMVGDIDVLVTCDEPARATSALIALPAVAEVVSHTPMECKVTLDDGLPVHLLAYLPERYGSLLQYCTGSKAHNMALRELAQQKGLSGFKRGEEEILCRTEEQVYAALGLPWIPPELREDRGEVQAAQAGALPRLLEPGDIRGDLHCHTTWSDGTGTLAEMAEAAIARGDEYLVISDHTHSLGVARGLNVHELRAQGVEIKRLNAQFSGFRLLHGTEVEVHADGTLDYPDDVLEELDIVIASVHSAQRQNKDAITARTVRALRNPHVDILAHPSGRVPGYREASNVDLDTVLQVAAETGTILEVNAHRLDLDDVHARQAVSLGVPLSIVSDAHNVAALDTIAYAVATARRGWVEPQHVVNTLSLAAFLDLLARKKTARADDTGLLP